MLTRQYGLLSMGCWSGSTTLSNTGPSSGREGPGNYNSSLELLSPSFNLAGITTGMLEFRSHGYNGNNNDVHDLIIDIVDACTGRDIETELLTIQDTEVNDWLQYEVDLSAYAID